MSQQQNTVNLFIEDVNGQQVIKLATSALPSKSINMINAGVYRATTQDGNAGSATTTGGQILRTINIAGKAGSHIMAVPTSSPVKVVEYKGDSSGQMPKTIQLLPAQVQMLGSQRLTSRTTNQSTTPIIVPAQPVSNAIPVQSAINSKNYISPILDHSGSRKRHEIDTEQDYLPEYSNIKRRKSEKMGKGLRHFSMKVCEKVRKKGTTSYNEVADELVAEFTNPINTSPSDQFDQKNIRRRVYDALNVLMAMNIISKEKKEIRWLGLPTNSAQECTSLEKHKESLSERIREKTHQLQELILQQISFKSLVERNRGQENKFGPPASNTAIQLPFIIVNTSKQTVIECRISNDKMEYLFNFDDKFEIHDDIEVLKRMGMVLGLDQGKCTPEQLLKAKSMVPANLESYVVQLANGKTEPDIEELLAGPSAEEEPEVPLVGSGGGAGAGHTGVELSRHSSHTSLSDPMSPSMDNFSDEESEMSSDLEVH